MRKVLLTQALILLTGLLAANAQVAVFFGQPTNPGDNITVAGKPANDGSWGFGNIDTMRIRTAAAVCVRDGNNDTTGCTARPTRDLAGKIAVCYRSPAGVPAASPLLCEFGVRSKNLQARGAIAVIIVNARGRSAGGMAGGAVGGDVTIPVVLIDVPEGERYIARLCAGELVSIGTLTNGYDFNLRINPNDAAVFPYQHYPSKFYGTATSPRFDAFQNVFRPQLNVANIGRQAVSNAKVTVSIIREFAGNVETLYADSDAIASIAPFSPGRTPGDTSGFLYKRFDIGAIPFNSAGTRDGKYTLTYQIKLPAGVVDAFPNDNQYSVSMFVGPKYLSVASLNINSSGASIKSNDFNRVAVGAYRIGVSFETYDRPMKLDSLGTAVSVGVADDITQESAALEVYEWDDANEDGLVSDAEIANLLGSGNMDLSDPSANGKFQWVSIADIATNLPLILPPGKTYIMMFNYQGPIEFNVAFESNYDVSTVNTQDSIIPGRDTFRSLTPLNDPARQWFVGYQAGDAVAMAAIFDENFVKVKSTQIDLGLQLYPVPVRNELTLSLSKNFRNGIGHLIVTDLAGKVVYSGTKNLEQLVKVSTTDFAAGMYQLRLESKAGVSVRKFSVVK